MTGEGSSNEVAQRVARNTGVRAVAELVAKFSSLVLIAVLARQEGPAGLGVFVFALAWAEVASTPVEMGFDRYFLRMVARDRAQLGPTIYNVLLLKLQRAVPCVTASFLLVWALGYDSDTRAVIYLLTVTYLLDSVSYTVLTAFNAVERSDLFGIVLVVQRLLSGSLGVLALVLDQGVPGVATGYVVAAAVGVAVGFVLLARHVGLPRPQVPIEPRAELRRQSVPFAAQEFLSAGIARLDAILLSVIASQSVVGFYGAAYRLLEATLFISTSLQGAFSAMFSYLEKNSEPTISAVFSRALKASFVLLLPCAVTLAVLAEPILGVLFGERFEQAAPTLRILAPTVVILGNVLITGSLIGARLEPRVIMRCFVVAFAVNLGANLALIPLLEAEGAALAMLLTEVVLGVMMLRIAAAAVGRPDLKATAGAALAAGIAMAAVMALLQSLLPVALVAGGLAYATVFVLAERRAAPADLQVLSGLLRSRLPGRLRR